MSVRIARIVNPTAEDQEAELSLASPVPDLNGKVIGFIDNGWWSLKVTLKKVQELFEQRYNAEIIWRTKQGSKPTSKDVLEELTQKADLVVCGMAN
ncbi:MAG: hypothetical protein HYX92_06795 [Chloroflexi bacterium]|nr:hypothetical protein [Chloroflexota bacterium]